MYDPAAVLHAIDIHRFAVIAGFGLAMVLQNVAMFIAVVMTKRHGVLSIPLPCTYLWFAHDFGAVIRFDTWFHDYGRWFLKLFWLGLLSALVIEVVFLWQAAKVGRQEYLPGGTQARWVALLFTGLLASVVLWEYHEVIFDDPIYQAAPAITLFLLPVATAALLLRRRSFLGQSAAVFGCFAGMVPLWWAVTAGAYGGAFRSWQYVTTGVLAGAMLIGVTVVVWRANRSPSGSLGRAGGQCGSSSGGDETHPPCVTRQPVPVTSELGPVGGLS